MTRAPLPPGILPAGRAIIPPNRHSPAMSDPADKAEKRAEKEEAGDTPPGRAGIGLPDITLAGRTHTAREAKAARAHLPKGPAFSFQLRLFVLTICLVMVTGLVVFAQAMVTLCIHWADDRLTTARIAARFAASTIIISQNMQKELLDRTGAYAIILDDGASRRLVAVRGLPAHIDLVFDHREPEPALVTMGKIFRTLTGERENIRIIGNAGLDRETTVEVVLPARTLRRELISHGVWLLPGAVSVAFSVALLLCVTAHFGVLRPLRRLARSIRAFGLDPANADTIIRLSGKTDEFGTFEAELQAMQTAVHRALREQNQLANLGMAASKINHDMRNILGSARLFSESLGNVRDERTRVMVHKIIAALDRALAYSHSVLSYGTSQEAEPKRRILLLGSLVSDVQLFLGLDGGGDIQFRNNVESHLVVDADPEQLFRILSNLCRNSVHAMQGIGDNAERLIEISAEQSIAQTKIFVRDTGPGIPDDKRASLFQPFQRSTRTGGSGLGLAITAELVKAHHGTIGVLNGTTPGTTFEICLPFSQNQRGAPQPDGEGV